MNKIKKVVRKNGKFLGAGCDREAFLYGSYVWKFNISEDTDQAETEQDFIKHCKAKNIETELIPNMVYLSDKISYTKDVVLVASDDSEYLQYARREAERDPYFRNNIYTYMRFLEEKFYRSYNGLMNQLNELLTLGLADITTNTDNFGRIDDRLVIVDFGMSQSDEDEMY